MAEVIEIKPKGIYIKIEFALEELQKIKRAMDMCQVRANLNDEEEKEAHDYFVKDHYSFIKNLVEDLERGIR